MILSNIWKISSVLQHYEGPQTAIKSLSLVDIAVDLDLEESSQLCTKAMKI